MFVLLIDACGYPEVVEKNSPKHKEMLKEKGVHRRYEGTEEKCNEMRDEILDSFQFVFAIF